MRSKNIRNSFLHAFLQITLCTHHSRTLCSIQNIHANERNQSHNSNNKMHYSSIPLGHCCEIARCVAFRQFTIMQKFQICIILFGGVFFLWFAYVYYTVRTSTWLWHRIEPKEKKSKHFCTLMVDNNVLNIHHYPFKISFLFCMRIA